MGDEFSAFDEKRIVRVSLGLPGRRRKVSGELAVAPGAFARVRFDDVLAGDADDAGSHDCVWAEAGDSRTPVTLLRLIGVAKTLVFGATKTRVHAQSVAKWALVGHHITPPSSAAISSVRVRWAGSEIWYGKQLAPNAQWWLGEPIQTPTLAPVVQRFTISSIRAEFTIEIAAGTESTVEHSILMYHHVWWRLNYEPGTSLDDVLQHVRVLRDFMWLAQGDTVGAIKVEVCLKVKGRAQWLPVLGGPTYEAEAAPPGRRHELCLPHALLGENFGPVLDAWFRLRTGERTRDAFSAWREVISGRHGSPESVAGARATFLDGILPQGERAKLKRPGRIKERVLRVLPTDLPDQVTRAIARAIEEVNRPSFLDKLRAARDALPKSVVEAYDLDDGFLNAVKDTRNRVLHNGGFGDDLDYEPTIVAARMRIFAIAHVLIKVGISGEDALRRLKACAHWHVPFAVEPF